MMSSFVLKLALDLLTLYLVAGDRNKRRESSGRRERDTSIFCCCWFPPPPSFHIDKTRKNTENLRIIYYVGIDCSPPVYYVESRPNWVILDDAIVHLVVSLYLSAQAEAERQNTKKKKKKKKMLWKAALTRRISRMVFKCRLSLTSPARTSTTTTNRNGFAGISNKGKRSSSSSGSSSSAASVVRADNAYLLAVFFVFFLLVMIVAQVMVMRSELSSSVAGKSSRSFRPIVMSSSQLSSSSSTSSSSLTSSSRHQTQSEQKRPYAGPFRFGRQPAPFGRVLAADRRADPTAGDTNASAGGPPGTGPSASDLIHDPSTLTAGEWLKRLPQEQGRDAWANQLWLCFQGQSVCPWQPVSGREKCFVYSAYLDDTGASNTYTSHPTGTVRVIGVAKTKKPDRLWCQLGWASAEANNNSAHWITVPAQIKTIREHWNLRYSAVFILCPLLTKNWPAGSPIGYPQFVSISTKEHPTMPDHDLPIRATANVAEFNITYGHWSDSPTGNLLPVIRYPDDPQIRNQPKHELSVCVKPLHYSFNRVDQLIEFIEIHRLLGVSHFTFYNHTVGENCDCVLRRYVDEGLVEILPWNQLDVISQKEIRTEGKFTSHNFHFK